MKDRNYFIVSFGNSDKYAVSFDGSKEEFEKSDTFRHIKDDVIGAVKEKFPEAACKFSLTPKVEDAPDDKAQYPILDPENLEKLKRDALRQIEVKMQDKTLNSDAPYSGI